MAFRFIAALAVLASIFFSAVAASAEECARPGCWMDVMGEGQFTISLNSNPTTGYQWTVDYDQSHLTLVDGSFQPPDVSIPGAGGKSLYTFAASNPGASRLQFRYSRPWESRPPADTRNFVVQSEVQDGQVVIHLAEVTVG
jgi:inhibitor of cysteine peptidase